MGNKMSQKEFDDEICRIKKVKESVVSYKTYSTSGSDLIGLCEQIIDLSELLYEANKEIEQLKKKNNPRVVYKART